MGDATNIILGILLVVCLLMSTFAVLASIDKWNKAEQTCVELGWDGVVEIHNTNMCYRWMDDGSAMARPVYLVVKGS